jgi:hypothetical protein
MKVEARPRSGRSEKVDLAVLGILAADPSLKLKQVRLFHTKPPIREWDFLVADDLDPFRRGSGFDAIDFGQHPCDPL